MADILMPNIVMAYTGMAYLVMAYIVMASSPPRCVFHTLLAHIVIGMRADLYADAYI